MTIHRILIVLVFFSHCHIAPVVCFSLIYSFINLKEGIFLLPTIEPPKRSTPAPFLLSPSVCKSYFSEGHQRRRAPPSLLRVEMCTRLEHCSTFDSVSCLCRSCRASVCPFSLSCRVASCSFISLCGERKQQTTGLSLIT